MEEIIHLIEPEIKKQLEKMVLEKVEETLNAMLDEEADQITGAHRYKRTEDRADMRAGHYTRKLVTKAGEVTLKVASNKTIKFFIFALQYITIQKNSLMSLRPGSVSFFC